MGPIVGGIKLDAKVYGIWDKFEGFSRKKISALFWLVSFHDPFSLSVASLQATQLVNHPKSNLHSSRKKNTLQ